MKKKESQLAEQRNWLEPNITNKGMKKRDKTPTSITEDKKKSGGGSRP